LSRPKAVSKPAAYPTIERADGVAVRVGVPQGDDMAEEDTQRAFVHKDECGMMKDEFRAAFPIQVPKEAGRFEWCPTSVFRQL
jgi:hypothetical protein